VKKRTQLAVKLGGAAAFTKRSKNDGSLGRQETGEGQKAAKKFKGVRREK
jgi:hypothetical protein